MLLKSGYFRSVSFIALSAAIGLSTTNVMAGAAKAENVINYEEDNTALENDPLGRASGFKSLYSTTGISNNTLNVGSETDKTSKRS